MRRNRTPFSERVGTLRDFMADRRAARMNEILYVLTLVSTIMLPLTFITSVFGMNAGIAGSSVRGMSSTLALAGVCAALAVIAWLEYSSSYAAISSCARLRRSAATVQTGYAADPRSIASGH